MARDSEKARPQVLPPTSKANGMEETVTARKMADEKTRNSHMGKTRGAQRWDEAGRNWSREGQVEVEVGEAHDFIFLFLFSSLSPFHVHLAGGGR